MNINTKYIFVLDNETVNYDILHSKMHSYCVISNQQTTMLVLGKHVSCCFWNIYTVTM